MKQISFRLTKEQYILAEYLALKNGYKSIPKYVKDKIIKETNMSDQEKEIFSKLAEDKKSKGKKSKQITVFLYDHEIEILKRDPSVILGMSKNKLIAQATRKTLQKENPILCLNELKTLNNFKEKINTIGRSIHKSISGERILEKNDKNFREEIKELYEITEKIKVELNQLTKNAINRFE